MLNDSSPSPPPPPSPFNFVHSPVFSFEIVRSPTRLPAKQATSSTSFSISTALYPIIYTYHLLERAGNSNACSEIAGKVTRPSREIAVKGEYDFDLSSLKHLFLLLHDFG